MVDVERGARVALGVEVDHEGLESVDGEGGGEVHRAGGLADTPLLVGDRHDPAAAGTWQRPFLRVQQTSGASSFLGDRRPAHVVAGGRGVGRRGIHRSRHLLHVDVSLAFEPRCFTWNIAAVCLCCASSSCSAASPRGTRLRRHPPDQDDRAGDLEHRRTALGELRVATARLPDGGPIPLDLLARAGALEGDQEAVGTNQGEAPVREPGERGNRASGDDIGATQLLAHRPLLRASTNDGDREFQLFGHLGQPVHPAGHRFEKNDTEVRSGDRERYSREPRTGPDIDHAGTLGDALADDSRVEHMPFPQPVHLTRADQPALDAMPLQEFDVPGRLVDVLTEHSLRRGSHHGGGLLQAHYVYSSSARFT